MSPSFHQESSARRQTSASYKRSRYHPYHQPSFGLSVGGVAISPSLSPLFPSSTSFLSTSTLIPIFIGLFALMQIPIIQSQIKAQLGIWSIGYHEIQLAYLLSNKELQECLSTIHTIQLKYSHQHDWPVHLTEEMCLLLLRLKNSLTAASVTQINSRDTIQRRDSVTEKLASKSLSERAKYTVDITASGQSSVSGHSPSPGYSEYSGLTGAEELHKQQGVHTELRSSSSYLVFTILLVSIGPSFPRPITSRSLRFLSHPASLLSSIPLPGKSRHTPSPSPSHTHPVTHKEVTQLLSALPSYVRKLSSQQQRVRDRNARMSVEEKEKEKCEEEPGFEVDVVWTPATTDECIDDATLREIWPELEIL